jgi:predicted HTH domain antitoxin
MIVDTIIVTIELPRDLLVDLNIPAGETNAKVREWVILELYREYVISAGKAAELLGLTKNRFIDLLDEHRIPYLDLTAADLEEDVRVAGAAVTRED